MAADRAVSDLAAARNGLLVVDKPAGLTSHGVVARIRRLSGVRKAGHAGTLDPDATGVLVVGLGRATRLLGYLALGEKTYRATVRLGRSTTTDDAAGQHTGGSAAAHLTGAQVDIVLQDYLGWVDQRPSSVSAIRVDGKRAHRLARAGQVFEIPTRRVQIRRLQRVGEVRMAEDACLDFDLLMSCSAGTYVRALARDVGNDFGVGGHLIALRRESAAGFSAHDAIELADLQSMDVEDWPVQEPGPALASVLPQARVPQEQVALIHNGVRVAPANAEEAVAGQPTALRTADGRLVAVAKLSSGRWHYQMVYA